MSASPKNDKSTRLKRAGNQSVKGSGEGLSLLSFWLAIGLFALLSGGVVVYNYNDNQEADEDAYFSVQVETTVGDEQNAICKFQLLIDPEQKERLQKRQKELEVVASAMLTEMYQGEQRPTLAAVRRQLYVAINQKLPRKLQIRDLLIQDCLVGNS